ncbi:MAG: hypothetical protein IPO22_13795 [Anaerolineales bacterium]|nr:hypothetical protein [Anaerolineales bacterium]
MKIAFVFSKAPHYFFYDQAVRLLYSMGHEVVVVCRSGFEVNGNKSGRALIKLLEDEPCARLTDAIFRGRGAAFSVMIRELANYANFLRPGHPMPPSQPWENIYMRGRLSPRLYKAVKSRVGAAIFSTVFVRWLLRWIESLIPSEHKIEDWLKENAIEMVVVSPYIMTSDLEIEYVKSARKLGIPTIASVLSWDNLVSKGTYLVKPEWLFVWNQNLVEEAVRLHEFSRESIFTVGAPVYDPWFEITPALNRGQFCGQSGLNPAVPFILFLGSSPTITELDVELIKALMTHLEKIDADKRPSILIRPHPYNPFDMTVFENDWVKVFPKQGGRPDMDDTRQTYFESLYYSAVVIGVNTTGFLDAAIVDKPCVTLMDEQMREGQGAHFNYLIDADYIEIARERTDIFEIIDRVLGGVDIKMENRRRFVRQFMRPNGVDISASQIMANAILAVGHGRKPQDWKAEIHE